MRALMSRQAGRQPLATLSCFYTAARLARQCNCKLAADHLL
jgi:hypothetical protein